MYETRKFEKERQKALNRKARVEKIRKHHQVDEELLLTQTRKLLLLTFCLLAAGLMLGGILFFSF